MKTLNLYITKTIINTTLLVLLLIAGVELFVTFLAQLDDIGINHYEIFQAFVYVLSRLPSEIYPLFPPAALMGCLIGLGRLASQSELVVMQASGISKMQITGFVISATLLMLVFVTAIGEGLNPKLVDFAEGYKTEALTGNTAEARGSLWIRDGGNFIRINQVLADGKLLGVLRYQLEGTKLRVASSAAEGNYQNGHWVFSNVNESVFANDQVTLKHSDTQIWPIALDPEFVGISKINPQQASLIELHQYVGYLDKNGLNTKRYDFEFWKRIFQPLVALVMIGLAIPFIFGPLRTKTMGFRVLVGVIVGFGFYTFNEFVGPFSLLYQIPPFVAAVVPLLIVACLDIILLSAWQ